MSEKIKLGDKGEELAAEMLAEKGYVIISANWRAKHKELDIIAMDGNILVFVEVKTRSENFWGNPEEFVTRQKQKLLIKAAETYISETGFSGESRFDVVSVLFLKSGTEIEHIIEAFYP
ncbi:MAG: YraN family protein [Bacteroidales bacterium]|jgi:putative endonuclease|nr:YraN family protein [Bacteroidales bacterium]MCK9498031.1 YraN family protein [Bacteroidales bacterium]MDY0315412.1 YraN family protein [Bacteroidales bacterium]NLB86197.1 YraN family protein [Bacteroidales bacterium]